MKKLVIALVSILLLGITACTEKSHLVDPNSDFENPTLSKKIINQTDISITQRIRNNKGGRIKLKSDLDQESGQKSVAYLIIPKNALPDKVIDITVSFVPGQPHIEFGPPGIEFSKPLILNLKMENMWFSEEDKNKIDFKYMDVNGTPIEDVDYTSVELKYNKNYMRVREAKISHFSRYGFTR